MDITRFNRIKEKYQYYASWAVWAEEGNKPKSNVGNLNVLDPKKNRQLLEQLNPNIILVALNISVGDIEEPFGNFHSSWGRAQDYKIRYAIRDTPLWGAYMTDIIKDYENLIASNVTRYLNDNPKFEAKNIEFFKQELMDIGSDKPKLIAFGNAAYDILERNFRDEFEIFKITHYSASIYHDDYRNEVIELCKGM